MSTTPATLLVTQLRERLTAGAPDHPDFIGAPVDVSLLSPRELGSLWPLIQHARWGAGVDQARRQLAIAILAQTRALGLMPLLDGGAGLAVFRGLAGGNLERAVETLAYLEDETAPELAAALADEIRRILSDKNAWPRDHYRAYALARLADAATREHVRLQVEREYAQSPFLLQEFALLPQLGRKALMAMAGAPHHTYWIGDDDHGGEVIGVLAADAAYIDFTERLALAAAARLAAIHAGAVAYVADGAFTTHDAQAIALALRVASHRDEPWLGGVIATLLPQACVAPSAAKTVPSQSLAIALGHVVEAVPTPESVQALRAALAVLRHAGVQKKLARNVKPAERALAGRPEIALRLTATATPDKRAQATLASCLEAGLWRVHAFSWDEWRARLADTAVGAPLVHALVWRATDADGQGRSFMLEQGRAAQPRAVDSGGQPVAIGAGSHIALWHPLLADDAERGAWRARLLAAKIRQPFRQAWREYYLPHGDDLADSRSAAFAGHVLSLRPLIGLARREGWRVDRDDGLTRQFGDVQVALQVPGGLYPGAQGAATSEQLVFALRRDGRWCETPIGELDPMVFSEACRAVDLLVSVAAIAIALDEETHTPWSAPRFQRLSHLADLHRGDMAAMRRQVLDYVFAERISAGQVGFDDNHLLVGDHAVHLATARVTRAGAAVQLAAPAGGAKLAAVPWLPYDEVLLQKIVTTAGALLRGDTQALSS